MPKVESTINIQPTYPSPLENLKNVILIADNRSTEIFDLLSPYYLFKKTEKANVFIVAKHHDPVSLFRGLQVMPHHTFESFKTINVKPDLIIIPNLSSIKKEEMDDEIISFINSQYVENQTVVLSVCDGAATAAHTGIYDGHQITTHSSDIKKLSQQWEGPLWSYNIKVTQSNNLFSTAGVSNATEGSLFVIRSLFGEEIAERLALEINYPKNFTDSKRKHQPLGLSDKFNILSKIIFRNNKRLGFLVGDDISEFKLAALIDVYSRTFPESIHTFSANGKPILSQNGLTMIPTTQNKEFDEVHIIAENHGTSYPNIIGRLKVHDLGANYIFDYALHQIEKEFGSNFKNTVSKLLDYEN